MDLRASRAGAPFWGLLAVLAAAACAASEQGNEGPGTGGASAGGAAATGGTGGTAAGGGGQGGAGGGGGQGGAGGGCGAELCDGVDNDCDDVVDEDCPCVDGQTRPCFEGDPDLVGAGNCVQGTQTCDLQGVWGACDGDVLPLPETCDGEDEDCDHAVDEDLGTVTCGLGVCQTTVDACANGAPVPCIPGTGSQTEACDGLDNDCDGDTDEGCTCLDGATQPCYEGDPALLGTGECVEGEQLCASGQWGACLGDVTPTNESCNGKDDDCNGTVDNGNPGGGAACNTGLPGVCAPGHRQCTNGSLGCEQDSQASPDLCDGLDNDCNASSADGSADPGLGGACDGASDSDLCPDGGVVCTGGSLLCADDPDHALDVCDGLDNDCDAASADGTEDPLAGTACDGPDSDLCVEGSRLCSGGTLLCTDNTSSSTDVCDALDNDCDAASADGSEDPGAGQPCDSPADSDLCATGLSTCAGGALGCSDDAASALDLCNGQNDDCDASSPDGSEDPQIGAACDNPVDTDLCLTGVSSCVGGALACSDDAVSSVDACNGADDDCDAASPDGGEDPAVGVPCDSPADTDLCATGVSTCAGGALGCSDDAASTVDVCNGLNDDCDASSPDGSEDPSVGQPCDNPADTDLCATGVSSCVGGVLACSDDAASTVDVCNGVDDDCDPASPDGSEDGGVGQPCDNPVDTDLCATGLSTCSGGVLGCSDDAASTVDACNGLNDDCDASSPDGSEDPSVGQPCDSPADSDLCATGVSSCSGGALACSDDAVSALDLCNGANDDCDAASADGSEDAAVGQACDNPADSDLCATGLSSCSGGALSCSDDAASTLDLCNGVDDDCNGATADGSGDPSVGSACDGPDSDTCEEGLRVCSAGSVLCSDATGDEVELCNGIDDDCDLAVDEGFDLSSDPNHCGDCLTACSNLCCGGGCTASSVTNCGACGHACVPGMLVITELLIDPLAIGDTAGEWLELYNPNAWDIDLRGFVLRDLGADTHTISSPQPVVIPASSYAVLGINANSSTNGGVTVLYQYSSFALGNSGDEAVLEAFGVELDRVVWAGTFDPSGASKELSRNHLDYLLNDDTTATGFWRAAVSVFGAGDKGTPGAVNDCSL